MPYDVRQVSFTRDEVLCAILELSRTNVATLPPGKIVGLTLGSLPEVTATLAIRRNAASPAIPLTLSSVAVTAALILYCVNRGIPLPAQATKRLELVGDTVCLVAERELKAKRPHSASYGAYVPENALPAPPRWARRQETWA